MTTEQTQPCRYCGEGKLVSWDALSDEEREVVRRLPLSSDFSQEERELNHRWCSNCWYEETGGEPYDA